MPKLHELATVTHRGKNIPDVSDDLPYSSFVLHAGVSQEMGRLHMPSVVRDGVDGYEGPLSVPNIMRFLWPGMSASQFRDRSSEEYKARVAVYDFLRDTKNMICITPGNQFRTSVWWVRKEWNDVPASAARPEAPTPESNDSMTHTCPECQRTFESAGHMSRHYYSVHASIKDLILEALTHFGKSVALHEIYDWLKEPPRNFTGGTEMVRYQVNVLASDDGPVVARGEKMSRRYSLRAPTADPVRSPQQADPVVAAPAAAPASLPAESAVPVLGLADIAKALKSMGIMLHHLSESVLSAAAATAPAAAAADSSVAQLEEENRILREQIANLGVLMRNL